MQNATGASRHRLRLLTRREVARLHSHCATARDFDADLASLVLFPNRLGGCQTPQSVSSWYNTKGAVSFVAIVEMEAHCQHGIQH
jgi:hypothetical protein